MLGLWDDWYKDVKQMGSFRYGNTASYQKAADFLADCNPVEDWGGGAGGFKRIFKGNCILIDGSNNPYVDTIADLRYYKSSVEGINMRHVLEHNHDWQMVLDNALNSFSKKFCLVIFTPFQDETRVLKDNAKDGVDVPDIGFKQSDIEDRLKGLTWTMETIKSHVHYKQEYIYYIQK